MGLYRVLMALLAPLLCLWALGRVLLGRERFSDFLERIGAIARPETRAPTIWLHAASNGELASAEEVIRAMLRADPALRLMITTNSLTGRALARRWDLPNVRAHLAPFDWRWVAVRLVRHWNVVALILLESEFWPNRIHAAALCGAPVCVIGARLSRRSARSWRRVVWLTRPVLGLITWVVPQDNGSRRRIRSLGMDPMRLGPVTDLKALYDQSGKPGPDPQLKTTFAPAHTWLAASTHPGEDAIVLDAHATARKLWPELELILAPRHPKRAGEILGLISERGLPVRQRSVEDVPLPGAIYLADTLGEMPRFYANAGICLVAGSLVERGGHTPYEPAAFGCALLHGPYLRNFQAPYRRLDIAGGALQVRDADTLATALVELRDPARRAAMVQNAKNVLGTGTGPAPLAHALLKHAGRPVKLT